MVGLFLAALDQTITAAALPVISRELGGAEQLSWIVAGYLLTSTAATPIYGKLSDLYGRRALLRVAITVFVLASLLCGAAQTMPQLIVARALQGMGGGGLMTLAQATVADVVSPRERGRYQAYFSGTWALASVAGPSLGGFFSDYLTWRWIFWINLPIGIVAFVLCHVALRRLAVAHRRHSIDYLGALLITAGVAPLLLLTTWAGGGMAWTSPTIIGLGIAGIVLLGLFALQERRAAEPILPPRLLANRVILIGNLISFEIAIPMFGATVLMPVLLQLAYGLSPSRAGLMLLPFLVVTTIGASLAGQGMRRWGRYRIFPQIGAVFALVGLALLAGLERTTPLPVLVGESMLVGFGVGMFMPTLLVAVQNAAAPQDIGAATSTVAFFRILGGSFGVAILWSLVIAEVTGAGANGFALLRGGPEALGRLAGPEREATIGALLAGSHAAFAVAAAAAALSFVTSLIQPDRPLRSGAPRAATPAEGAGKAAAE
jgi:EmrB/QacA subfamily drug resistance transporter